MLSQQVHLKSSNIKSKCQEIELTLLRLESYGTISSIIFAWKILFLPFPFIVPVSQTGSLTRFQTLRQKLVNVQEYSLSLLQSLLLSQFLNLSRFLFVACGKQVRHCNEMTRWECRRDPHSTFIFYYHHSGTFYYITIK